METEHYLSSCDKRELLDRITEILKTDILTKSDKRSIRGMNRNCLISRITSVIPERCSYSARPTVVRGWTRGQQCRSQLYMPV